MAKRVAKKIASTSVAEATPISVSTSRPKTLVFISHDNRNADLAEAFANLLSDVSGGTLKSFRSSDKKGTSGLEFGAEWYNTIMAQISDATNVVALLTTQSMDRPWILYEAGVAKGKLDTVVFGLALGVPLDKVSAGPFGQFQNCGDDEDSLTKLVIQLLKQNPDAEPRDEAVRTQVKVFKERVGKIQTASPKAKTSQTDEQNIAKLFEEVKAMVREIPEQLTDRISYVSKRDGRRYRGYHPRIFKELFFDILDRPGGDPAIPFVAALSTFQDNLPWLVELGREVVAARRSGNRRKFDSAREVFMRAFDYVAHSKVGFELLGEEGHVALREVFSMLQHYLFDGAFSKLPQPRFLVAPSPPPGKPRGVPKVEEE